MSTLSRRLGLGIATAVVVGNVIGSGIFLKPGVIARSGGQFGLILLIWCLGGLLCLLGALCLAELAAMWPQAGGLYVYLRKAYGQPVAFLFGWSEFLFGKPASIGALSVAFVTNLPLPADTSTLVQVLLASVLICGLATVNIIGVHWGGAVQMVTTIAKAGGLVLIAALPFVGKLWLENAASWSNLVSTSDTSGPIGTRVGLVLLAVMWAYNGWHGVTPLAEEVREPQKNLPRALLGGIGILMLLYVTTNVAYHSVIPMETMAQSGEKGANVVMTSMLGGFGASLIAAIILCSTFGAINTNLLQAPRVTFAMGRDGAFFQGLGQVHATFRTPIAAIVVTAAMALTLVVVAAVSKWLAQNGMILAGLAPPLASDGTLPPRPQQLMPLIAYTLNYESVFELLTNFVIFSASVFNLLGALAVIVARYRYPDAERPYRTWGYPIVPLLFVAVYIWFLYQIYVDKPVEARTGLVLIGVGLPCYLLYRRFRRPS